MNNEVKKGFEEAADQVSKYFGWDNDKIIPNEKDKENNMENSITENNKILTKEEKIEKKRIIQKNEYATPEELGEALDNSPAFQQTIAKIRAILEKKK